MSFVGETPRVSVVVTAYNEGDRIVAYLERLLEAVSLPCEVLVVFDSAEDTTAPYVEKAAEEDRGSSRFSHLRSGSGVGDQIRHGSRPCRRRRRHHG